MQKPENVDIKSLILKIIPQLSNAMLSLEVTSSDAAAEPDAGVDDAATTLAFSGDLTGMFRLQPTVEFVQTMTAAKFDAQTENGPTDEDIQNVVSEFATAAADQIKTVMAEAGISCDYSASTTPDDENIQGNLERLVFQHGAQTLIVDTTLSLSGVRDDAEIPVKETRETINTTEGQNELKPVRDFDLDLVYDIPIELTVEIGRTKIPVHELLKLGPGSAVALSKLENEPVDILANDTLIARGQVVVQDEKYGIRVTEITSRMDRIKSIT
jgi:flagellar motor switch protein FliN